MCTKKFLIGGLIGVQVSGIVKWGYQDNSQPSKIDSSGKYNLNLLISNLEEN